MYVLQTLFKITVFWRIAAFIEVLKFFPKMQFLAQWLLKREQQGLQGYWTNAWEGFNRQTNQNEQG